MQVKDIMTPAPNCCTRDTSLTDVARLMATQDCGAIPVVEGGGKLVGIITDRDIVCRTLADGKDPFQMAAGDCMSMTVATVTPESSVEECARLMQQHQIRRVPVVDRNGRCCGMVAQADLARKAPERQTAQTVRQVSQPAMSAQPALH
jgi:CBS domain-containing protein